MERPQGCVSGDYWEGEGDEEEDEKGENKQDNRGER
jgi:hypothetical protein